MILLYDKRTDTCFDEFDWLDGWFKGWGPLFGPIVFEKTRSFFLCDLILILIFLVYQSRTYYVEFFFFF